MPAMHKKFEVIKQLFVDKKGLSPDADETQVMDLVRQELREKVAQSKVTISGANFLLADVGAVAVTENEGNFILAKAQAKTHPRANLRRRTLTPSSPELLQSRGGGSVS